MSCTPPLRLDDHSLTSLERTYHGHMPTLEKLGKDHTLLLLKHPNDSSYDTRILIDTKRHVILSIEHRHNWCWRRRRRSSGGLDASNQRKPTESAPRS